MARLLLLLCCALGTVLPLLGENISPLADHPHWAELDRFQETMTRADFERLLNEDYAPNQAAQACIKVEVTGATIATGLATAPAFTLRFAAAGQEKPASAAWRSAASLGPAPVGRPLEGVKIALDPGHLGGTWARMEERFMQLGESTPVQEGDMTLKVAQLLAPRLEALGATVSWVRAKNEPVTPLRPVELRPQARTALLAEGKKSPPENYRGPDDPKRAGTVQLESEVLFYKMSEIRQRARRVNEELKPDLTLCLHFDAEPWGEPRQPTFVPHTHLHLLVNGCYSAAELAHDDVRFEMLYRLLSRCLPEERAASEAVAASLAAATDLPPFEYHTPNAQRLDGSKWVWLRNLLANRVYRTPVVFTEPYVMNSELVWERVQLGDYEGEITVGGAARKSIYREYADGVAEGLRAYYETARGTMPTAK